ncbi:exported hypothetical protein [Cupriavidus taiwanensis]|uniref:Uncharacterized protein n=1 Tax=Cupriavidus taiwanensis TaxID=164546 RepID=A0A375C0J5_9BURK|nr:exported hypothetical protein [Cupriavidus taiwanensis]
MEDRRRMKALLPCMPLRVCSPLPLAGEGLGERAGASTKYRNTKRDNS